MKDYDLKELDSNPIISSKLYPFAHSDHSDTSSNHSEFPEEKEELSDEEKNSYDGNQQSSNEDESIDASVPNDYEDLLALDESVTKKGLLDGEVKKFPTYIYLSSDKEAKPEASCIVCMSAFDVGEIVREIPCTHEFHRDCIDKWFKTSIRCPSCNKQLR